VFAHRRDWTTLPEQVRTAVHREVGEVVRAEEPSAGRNSDLSATLHLARGGRVFCKGVDLSSSRARMHRHEARINPWLPHPPAPQLLWQVEICGWLLLGFEHTEGQHADLSPESPDLPAVADAVSTLDVALQDCRAKGVPTMAAQWDRLRAWRSLRDDPDIDLDPAIIDRLGDLVAWESDAIGHVDGHSLVHTDLHPLNILVRGDAVRIVDWAWSRLGAAWIDPAFLVIRLIAAGHAPDDAERWAERVPSWHAATADARTAFAVAVWGIWEHLQQRHPLPHRSGLTAAVRTWALYRMHQAGTSVKT
jgi:Ser/Thr protein kinase RdoA (MazF antagonist)